MNLKFFGATASALLLATALAGCNGSNGGGNGTSTGNPSDAVATVGGTTLTRAQLDQTLEGVYGEQMLPTLIDTQLLAEELKAKNLSVSDEEVTAELTRLQDQDPTIKTALDAGGPRVEVIKNQVRRNLTAQKLLTEGITSDEAKEKAFFNTYSSYYATPTQNKLGLIAASTKTRIDQISRALKADPASFAKLVDEQKAKAATDQIAGQSTADVGRFETPEEFATSRGIPAQGVPPQLAANIATLTKALATAKKDQIMPTLALTPQGPFILVKVIDRKEGSKPDFTKMRDMISTDYKMAQAAFAEIKKNPQNPQNPQENIKQVAQLLSQSQPGAPAARPAMRDILTYILRPASQNLLTKLRGAGTVQISDTTYKDIAKQYQPVAPTPGAPGAEGNSAAPGAAAPGAAAPGAAAPGAAAPAANSAAQ